MYRGSTPTLPIRIIGKDLTEAKLFLTIQDKSGKNTTITSDSERFTVEFDGQDTVGEVELTQTETLAIEAGNAYSQIRFIFSNGKAGVTVKKPLCVNDVLLKDVISYGE